MTLYILLITERYLLLRSRSFAIIFAQLTTVVVVGLLRSFYHPSIEQKGYLELIASPNIENLCFLGLYLIGLEYLDLISTSGNLESGLNRLE